MIRMPGPVGPANAMFLDGAELRLSGGRPVLDPPARSHRWAAEREAAEAESSAVVRPRRPPGAHDWSQLAPVTLQNLAQTAVLAPTETAGRQRIRKYGQPPTHNSAFWTLPPERVAA